MRYLEDLSVKLDEAVLLAVLTEISAPTMGEMTRDGFVEGWKTHRFVCPKDILAGSLSVS